MNVRMLRRFQSALPNDPLLLTAAYKAVKLDAFRILAWNSATGFAITLPKSTGSGDLYYFLVAKAASSGSHTMVTSSGDFIMGSLWIGVTGGTSSRPFQANGTSNTTVSLNGGSTGGELGDLFMAWDAVAGIWDIQGTLIGSSASTPIS